ncbi:MAG: hypothetical protein UX75_C0036G0033 [Candidatus Moranbacteria bacterium GW2011_GWE2_47_10]|nr:MAG: hypothetical protein UX75_C0036G0033 [Candidatus Moranbacteria bacterium GW2011_GWE2_47_10]
MQVSFTIMTSEKPKCLTKRYWLEGDNLRKETVGQMLYGRADVVSANSIEEFADIVYGLKNNQALCYGTPKGIKIGDSVDIAANDYKIEGEMARTQKDFEWPVGGGVLFLDHDSGLSKKDFLDSIAYVLPELQTVDKMWMPSSSSYIFNGDKELTGIKGQRLYFFIDDASKILEIGSLIFKKLWLAGMGNIFISAAGSMLVRGPVDATVWQTNRFDFASGAKCEKPLEQKNRVPEILKGCRRCLEYAKVTRLTGKEEYSYSQLVAAEKAIHKAESSKQQDSHIEDRIKDQPEARKRVLRQFYKSAYNGGTLAGDFKVFLFKDGIKVEKTILEILRNRKEYHNCRTLDPIEPEYNDYHKTGVLLLDKSVPMLCSKAHGDKTYILTELIQKNENEEIFKEMQQDIKDQLAGKISTIPMPWTRLSRGTNALREGTVTIICGATKVGKSLFSMNIVKHLHENAVPWAYLPLEDGKKEWTWRIMAILENDFTMVEDNPETALRRDEVMTRRRPEIMSYLESVSQNPRVNSVVINGKKARQRVTPELILKWVESQARNGKRVIFVDPLAQISFGGFKRWEAEEAFVQEFCGIAADYKVSLVIISHTKKGNEDETLSVEDMQGSAAFGRLCQTSILIGATSEMVETDIKRPNDIEKVMSNRTVIIGAARNGAGTRSKLAFAVEPGSPLFAEIGYIASKKSKEKFK